MKRKTTSSLLIITGCITIIVCFFIIGLKRIAPNGPGSIQGYRYSTTKKKLENAVMAVIKNNPNIYRDTVKHYVEIINQDSANKKTMVEDDYDNDGKNF